MWYLKEGERIKGKMEREREKKRERRLKENGASLAPNKLVGKGSSIFAHQNFLSCINTGVSIIFVQSL